MESISFETEISIDCEIDFLVRAANIHYEINFLVIRAASIYCEINFLVRVASIHHEINFLVTRAASIN